MLLTNQDFLSTRPSGMTPNRAWVIGAVALLHVLAIYALVSGMAPQVVKLLPRDIQVALIDTVAPTTVPVVPQPKFVDPTKPDLRDVVIPDPKTNDTNKGLTTRQNDFTATDSRASALASTHSTPPYPAMARALSHQGTVTLQLTISPSGDVVAADIVQSSGFPELDQTAVAWVIEHWKYKPAIMGGMTVTSQTEAAVKFDLKDAMR